VMYQPLCWEHKVRKHFLTIKLI